MSAFHQELDTSSAVGSSLDTATPLFAYSSDKIRVLSIHVFRIVRVTRKQLFSNGIWRPKVRQPATGRGRSNHPPVSPVLDRSSPAPVNGVQLAT